MAEQTFVSPSSKPLKIEKQLCSFCDKVVYAQEAKVVDGKTMHAGCAGKYWQKQADEQRAKMRGQSASLLAGITNPQKPLAHVEEVHDTSAPQVESVPVRKSVHPSVMEQVQKVELKELKHVETVDKAAPVIESNTHVKKSPHPKVMNEIKGFKGFAEKKAEYEKQVQTQSEARSKVLEGISEDNAANLKHVEAVHDTSAPQVEAVPIRKNNRSQVMEQIQKVEMAELKHVETNDKAQPVIEKNVKVKKDVRPALFAEIKTTPKLAEKTSAYQQNVAESQKLNQEYHNREGSDVSSLSGVAKNKKAAYEQSVQDSSKLPVGIQGKEGADAKALESGIASKVKGQYEKEVESRNVEPETTQLQKDGDKVVYKNLPPKKDLNDLI